jgi:cellulose synthase/poly-beta-1,6-N-acetylglucosamine synthase-like glycosyltransferase
LDGHRVVIAVLLHVAVYFGCLSALTSVAALVPGAIRARIWAGLPVGILVAAAVTGVAALVGGLGSFDMDLAAVALVMTVLVRLWMWRWSWVGAQLFACALLASVAYVVYVGSITYLVGGDPVYLVASSLLLVLELTALLLSLTYLFEIVDTVSRRDEPSHAVDSSYMPNVAIQVPAYNEPIEVMRETLAGLAALDYPHLIVQIVDNNTPERSVWQGLQAECEKLGPRFQFIHLENWPGFKAGALNEATRRLPRDVELIGVVDSDYVVRPDWLRSVVGHFADERVAFVQSPQNYRDWDDNQYLRGLFYSYEYFFEVSMPARAHRNAIIFAGTMGVIRRKALDEIGGWNADIVTEDAEASLRMLANGYVGLYEPRPFGSGLMPLSFQGLKQQRFRWALGGVQILRLHWPRLLLPGQGGRLTFAQRAHYLLGNAQWFGDVLMFVFILLLLLTATSTAMHHTLPIRQLTGVAIGLPLIFLASGLLRAVWAMRLTTRCTWRDAVSALRVWFALSWVVTLACLRGLVRFKSTFLRTPKSHEGQPSAAKAFRSAQMETLLAVAGVVAAVAMVVSVTSFATVALAVLLIFQAAVYANGLWAGSAAEGVHLTPLRRAYKRSAQSTGARQAIGATGMALSAAGGLAMIVVLFLVSLATPPAPEEPTHPLSPGQTKHQAAPPGNPSPSTSPSSSPSSAPSGSPSASPS